VIVDNGGQWEPLFSIYKGACLPLIEANLAAGRRSLHALIKAGEFNFVEAPPEISALLVNVNTPEDWAALKSSS
jgi:molybdopterin-guanine dinucleotide biosynthesis protein A